MPSMGSDRAACQRLRVALVGPKDGRCTGQRLKVPLQDRRRLSRGQPEIVAWCGAAFFMSLLAIHSGAADTPRL